MEPQRRRRCRRRPRPTPAPGDIPIPIPEPEPAYIPDGIPDGEREATELRDTVTVTSTRHSTSSEPPSRPPLSRILSPGRPRDHLLSRFWRHHVRVDVPHVDCRDHLANERTFLGYLRTSVALSMMGIITAQLWRLQHSLSPDPVLGYYVLAKPVSATLHVSALLTAVTGATRFWRQQTAMALGKVHAGGWEMSLLAGFVMLLLLVLFSLHIVLDLRHRHPRV